METFENRREAGKVLAEKLQTFRTKAVVYALPRGGVEVAVEVARALELPLDLVIARKIGHPLSPEYAVCAVTETGPLICNAAERAHLDQLWLKQAETAERAEAKRRRESYMARREPLSARGKTAIVVDDGIATGLTMRAAIAELQKQQPAMLVVAVPCAPGDVLEELRECADDIVVLTDPESYRGSVGAYYDYFPQLTDREAVELLEEAAQYV